MSAPKRKTMDRRSFLGRCGAWGAAGALSAALGGAASTGGGRRPNVLFIISDDLNDWVLDPAAHPAARTPNMDRLRRRSVSFSNAHVVVPVCGPSRKCLWLGSYPQRSGSYDFTRWTDVPLLRRSVPLQKHFAGAGYEVHGTGKLFHRGGGGDFYDSYGVPPNYGPWPWKGTGNEKFTAHPAQVHLFEPHLPVGIHRDINFGPLSNVPHWKPDPDNDVPGYRGWRMWGEPFRWEGPDDRDRMPDELSADYAAKVLRREHRRPFLLAVGFIRPHTPLYAPQKYFDMFPLEDVRLPPYREGDLEDCAAPLRHRWKLGFQKFDALVKAGGRELWKRWVRAYLACVAFVDDQVGILLNALDDGPHADDTIVVLTGDHGYHVGEKDVLQKWHLWEESTRVPLFVRAPGVSEAGATCDHPVSLIDLYPTLADLCGLPRGPNRGGSGVPLDGHSLRPFLADPERGAWDGPPVALSAVNGPHFSDRFHGPHFSVRSRRYRYTLCAGGQEELYDHARDPHEWDNLAADPEYADVKARLRRELMKILEATRVPEGFAP